ncbi:MAG TPA: M23 family metallopeptidase, partial [Epsilonproteobacteria bacterium]|nr:M23 family metallopeptidase [Campylobacterota bacterium]
PQIKSQDHYLWNKKSSITLTLSDDVGIKSYQALLSDGENRVVVAEGVLPENTTSYQLKISYPKSSDLSPKAKHLKLKVSITDQSLWHMMEGNKAEKSMDIFVDTKRPKVKILSHSYSITQGGSALVVVQVEDANLNRVFISTPGKNFVLQPYKSEGYYAALIAWPFRDETFEAKVVADDRAGNHTYKTIPFYTKKHNYKVSWIRAKDRFIDGKITDLVESDETYENIDDRLEKLRAINETMRLKNEDVIHSLSAQVSDTLLEKWSVKRFYPLKNGAKVASFGDKRYYYYKDKNQKVSTSYHLGYDLASTKMATIRSSNKGKVVFSAYNGIYGNMPMIDHGLGLYSLYGHCSQLLVHEGDEVKDGAAIAKTGTSGLALGDHLHFGVLVQGIEVRPVEWFDSNWIKLNIDDIFKEADKMIGS